jgi:transcriptional regulator with XRE-family HTH domain
MARLPGFGDRLRGALVARNLSQADLARATAKTSGSVVRWLRGEIPALETLRTIARATGVPMSYLVLGDDAIADVDALRRMTPARRRRRSA